MDSKKKFFDKKEIMAAMPQQPPFLFLDEVSAEIEKGTVSGKYKIRKEEFFFEGHFKGNPVFPGTLMLETAGQLCVFGLIKKLFDGMEAPADSKTIFFMSSDGGRCSRICRPNETFVITAKPVKIRRPLAIFECAISVGEQRAAFVEKLALSFDWLKI